MTTAIPYIAAKGTYLDELKVRIRAITPEKYRVPKRQPDKEGTIVGSANEYLKQLYTLMSNAGEDAKPVANECKLLVGELNAYMNRGWYWKLINVIVGDPKVFMLKSDRIKELTLAYYKLQQEHQLLSNLFWTEAAREFPQLLQCGTSVWVDQEWNFASIDDTIPPRFTGVMPHAGTGVVVSVG